MEEFLQVQRFELIPSAEEFASRIEPKNVPAVFSGCVKDWKAFSKWNVLNGGLDYLQVNDSRYQNDTVLSENPLKHGRLMNLDIMDDKDGTFVYKKYENSARSMNLDTKNDTLGMSFTRDSFITKLSKVSLPFSTFIGYCKDLLKNGDDGQESFSQLRKQEPVELGTQNGDSINIEEHPHRIYLAQVPIVNAENEDKVLLESLREDIETPAFLEGKILASVNLWMNNARSRSSTHYDPHHNLLCIISGCKQVVLWPPSACPYLYPLPLYGEASNHSAIPLENPNFDLYPRAKSIDEYSQKVTLHAGDALFIPEGWFHQVDSGHLTIAVNFWWRSDMMSHMLEHMDAYYLRRILKRLTDKEMDRMLCMPSSTVDQKVKDAGAQSSNRNAGYSGQDLDLNHQTVSVKRNLEQGFSLHELEPDALRSLHELVSLVHDRVNWSQPVGNISKDQPVGGEQYEVKELLKPDLFNLEEDPIAKIVWGLESHAFQSVFLAMAAFNNVLVQYLGISQNYHWNRDQ
ncbi:UNVERIFIED_CONTAM: tRNA wybutosine-synthesizing protein 5 [Sesamum latifolium]|uniref:tRNA wybutosine-synthesizing protein 5 n=1 Tax=Sesamum latifolium TaxID=2727402 RepID=A0AAW2Y170_9LAMI